MYQVTPVDVENVGALTRIPRQGDHALGIGSKGVLLTSVDVDPTRSSLLLSSVLVK